MATPKINGTLQPIRQKISTRYDPAKGYVVTQEFESAGDNLAGLALQAKNSGMDYALDANARKSRLVMTTTGSAPGLPEQATSTWQLYTSEFQKDIREHPVAVAIGAADLAQIMADLEPVKAEGSKTYRNLIAPPFYVDGSDKKKLFDLMLHGVTSYSLFGFSARASISLPFLFSDAIPGVSPDSLMADLINDIPVNGPNDGTLFNWGWRRLGTSRAFSGNNRTEISIEWQLASWAFIYTDVTDLPE